VKNKDPRIDAYIDKSAEFARPILRHLRELVHTACPEVKESIKWSMPSFGHAGGILCNLAAFKEHCAFGFWHHDMKAVIAKDGGKAEQAMGGFGRITSLDDLPGDAAMLRYIKKAARLNESGKPARLRPAKPRKELTAPADFATALSKNKAAAKTFQNFSYTNRKEYIEWLTEAKRDETRQKRLATALEWLADGKPRNWKYLNC